MSTAVHRNRRWVILALMVALTFINYIDRSALGIVSVYIMEDFNLSSSQYGIISSAFFVSYAIFCFIGGSVSDFWGPKKTITIAIIAWSLFVAAPALAWGFVSLLVARILFGAAEGPVSSVTNKMINNWFPATERAKAKGITDTGMSLGAAISGPIVGLLAFRFNWRVSFVVLMVLGLIWVIFWRRMVTDLPRQHPKVSAAELAVIESGREVDVAGGTVAVAQEETQKVPLSFYLRQPIIWVTAVAFFATNYATYFFLTWFPNYLVTARDLAVSEMSFVNVIPWLFGALGYAGGGFVSDWFAKKLGDLIKARRLVISLCLAGAAASIGLCGMVTTTAAAVALMSVGIFLSYLATPSYWAIIQDSVVSSSVGRVGGFVHFLSNTAGIFAPTVTGFIVEASGSFSSAFLLTGVLSAVGCVCVTLFARPVRKFAPGHDVSARS